MAMNYIIYLILENFNYDKIIYNYFIYKFYNGL